MLDGAIESIKCHSQNAANTLASMRDSKDERLRRMAAKDLLDYEANLYGRRLELKFCRRIRAERRFASARELVSQIERDVRETREYFATCAC